MRIDPQLLTLFSQVAQLGSFSRAATHFNLDKSAISRAISKLENQLGVRLFYRNPRGLRLTDIGESVLFESSKINESINTIEHYADAYSNEVTGVLRVSCSPGFGRIVLLPIVDEFLRQHAKVQLQLEFEDRFVDLIAENIDVALRHAHALQDSTLVARPLCNSPRTLAAAPTYLAKGPKPSQPEDLLDHACLVYGRAGQLLNQWVFEHQDDEVEVRVQPHLSINDTEALIRLAVAGQGIILLDRFLLARELEAGQLVELLPQYLPKTGFPIYAVYPARKWLPQKTSAFIDFVQSQLN